MYEGKCVRPDGTELIVKRIYPKLAGVTSPSVLTSQSAYNSE